MATEYRRAYELDGEMEIDLRQLWDALVHRKFLIIGLFVVACVAAYLVSISMTPIYEATTTVLVTESGSGLESALFERLTGSSRQSALQRSVEVLKSRSVALRAARELGYDWDEYSSGLEAFRSSISVQAVTNSDMLRISVQHSDPQEAMRIANTMVKVFVDAVQEMNSENVRAARRFIGEQLEKFEADLEKAEEELVLFRQQVAQVQPSGETQLILSGITQLETLKAQAQVARETAVQRLQALRGELSGDRRSVVTSNVISSNPHISNIRSQLVNLEVQLAAAREQYTDAHPRVVGLQAQISELQAELSREIANLESTGTDTRLFQEEILLEAEILAEAARIEALERLIAEREAMLVGLPEKELQLTRLMRNANVTESIYTMLRQRYEEMRISEAMEAANVVVLDPAIIPQSPIKPRTRLNVAIAGFLGLFVGVGLAFMLEYLDTTFKTAEELEAYLGLPILGKAPDIAMVSPGKRRPN